MKKVLILLALSSIFSVNAQQVVEVESEVCFNIHSKLIEANAPIVKYKFHIYTLNSKNQYLNFDQCMITTKMVNSKMVVSTPKIIVYEKDQLEQLIHLEQDELKQIKKNLEQKTISSNLL